jgi:hypothetical protein
MNKLQVYLLLTSLILTSCKDQFLIRKYTSGKYFQLTNKSSRNEKTHSPPINFSSANDDTKREISLPVACSEKQSFTKKKNVFKALNQFSVATNSDTIYLKNSKTIAVKVSQISSENVNYTEIKGRFQSSLKSIHTKEIEKIYFDSGSYEYFNPKHPFVNPLLINSSKDKKEGVNKTGFAVFGYIITSIIGFSSILGSLLFGLLFIGIGLGGLLSIKLKHKSKKLLLVGIQLGKIFGAIYLSILLIAIISIIIAIVLI